MHYDIIADKRDGKELSGKDISEFLDAYLSGDVADYQMSALLMSVFFNGFSDNELKAWTEKMLFSGKQLSFSSGRKPVVDKHSTGGVGDKISIPLAPLLAALDFRVPMISGRGLGHTGGTLDKLESIPGYDTGLSFEKIHSLVDSFGAVITGQTKKIAPLDKRLYALRDVTGTVESIPLIASSIMSKKLAEGISALLLDVKVGQGAFMKTMKQARELASTMKIIGEGFGVRVFVIFTDMSEPLGYTVGNSLEIRESLNLLKGDYIPQVSELVEAMALRFLKEFDMVSDDKEGKKRISEAIESKKALKCFKTMIEKQGGDSEVVDSPDILPKHLYSKEVYAHEEGFIREISAFRMGKALVFLGGGRLKKEDAVDPGVGFELRKKCGDSVKKGDVIYTIYYNDSGKLQKAEKYLEGVFSIVPEKYSPENIIKGFM